MSESDRSLLAQSHTSPDRLQKDGWGLALYGEGTTPTVIKSPKGAYEEPERFKEAAGRPCRIVLGHIRHASNPMNLPPEKLLGPENTQPFVDGALTFAHNGTVYLPDELASKLGPLGERIKGVNDSEVYFYEFIRHYDGRRDPVRAFAESVEELWSLKGSDSRPPHLGLNVVASDGERLFAFCHYPETGLRGFYSDAPWGRMSFKAEDDRLLVASENLGAGWTYMEDPEVLVAHASGGKIVFERHPLKLSARAAAYKKVEAPKGDPAAPTRRTP